MVFFDGISTSGETEKCEACAGLAANGIEERQRHQDGSQNPEFK
jgi:hypothetical protein